ncbi:AbrB/MazE/SpoVT family DNA-binding domain-containing protein [Parerythrobacter lacustris]|uniref:AbrB/MazE/SpoVT family DNA-binding domain-containing protein n=1 Tax=Parerythrobacter lacustris TaxID=2969984 RepID=A0ABT1XLM8_9SPHN|nr:AbrB/MazE/SpoVT family DNA-binding domain-containing protein [Parerythrobacter lacustris]MCR2832569.1 AbrB/MazE/SpoVT family DNA-binding domain-containing protein [Parerythrobacter lacustris]
MRRALELQDGDEVRMEIVDGELRVIPFREVIRRVQEQFRRDAPRGVSHVDDFIAERRAEAERELG